MSTALVLLTALGPFAAASAALNAALRAPMAVPLPMSVDVPLQLVSLYFVTAVRIPAHCAAIIDASDRPDIADSVVWAWRMLSGASLAAVQAFMWPELGWLGWQDVTRPDPTQACMQVATFFHVVIGVLAPSCLLRILRRWVRSDGRRRRRLLLRNPRRRTAISSASSQERIQSGDRSSSSIASRCLELVQSLVKKCGSSFDLGALFRRLPLAPSSSPSSAVNIGVDGGVDEPPTLDVLLLRRACAATAGALCLAALWEAMSVRFIDWSDRCWALGEGSMQGQGCGEAEADATEAAVVAAADGAQHDACVADT